MTTTWHVPGVLFQNSDPLTCFAEDVGNREATNTCEDIITGRQSSGNTSLPRKPEGMNGCESGSNLYRPPPITTKSKERAAGDGMADIMGCGEKRRVRREESGALCVDAVGGLRGHVKNALIGGRERLEASGFRPSYT